MITKALLQEIRNRNSRKIGPILPSEKPNIRVDMRGLLEYARNKQIQIEDLTDDERAKFTFFII